MGYSCPVCGLPQADGAHLADHLAFTAILHGDAHADWLDEHVPDWGDRDVAALADAVTADAEEADYPAVFEDSARHRGRRAPDRPLGATGIGRATDPPSGAAVGDAPDAAEVTAVIEEARAMARERRERDAAGTTDDGSGEVDARDDGDDRPG